MERGCDRLETDDKDNDEETAERCRKKEDAMEKILQQSSRASPTDLYIKYTSMYMYVQ